ncbi:hypothetical protein [Polaromonas hydrogenivorans]|uniref:Uncharacterized protein n=1 Tax=Polaromonas hydrogenivorans TaxID=335476 RepID=A0AAU7LWT0_9BURK
MKKSLTAEQLKQLTDILERSCSAMDDPVQGVEFSAAELDFDMKLDIKTDFDFSALPPLPSTPSTSLQRTPCSGTRKISIRVSNAVLNAFRDQAKCKGTRTQTLINRVLKEKSQGW